MSYLTREIEPILLQGIKEFPIIALMGPRQVGKSTLLKHLFEKEYTYITFDDLSYRTQAKQDPALFIKNNPGKLILDEVQYAPEILSELKIIVDKTGEPGRFLLTGSQQFQVIKGMKETLAGRVLLLNLPVMTLMEKAGSGKQQHWLIDLLNNSEIDKTSFCEYQSHITPLSSLLSGGLPGILDKSDIFIQPFFDSYIKTYVERDIPLQYNVKDIIQIAQFMKLLAPLSSQEINKSQLGRELSISSPTANRWITWFKEIFLWYEIPAYYNNLIKRISRHSKGHLFDTGIICNLLRISDIDVLATHPLLGNIFETAMRIEILSVIQNNLIPAECYHWRNQYGHEVDIIIEHKSKVYAFECKWSSQVKGSDLTSLRQFKKNYGDSVAFTGIITPYGHFQEIEKDIFQIPWIINH